MILEPAPSSFKTIHSIDHDAFGLPLVERTDSDGRELVIADGSGELHVRLHDEQAARRPAVLLPLDGMAELRLDVALYFVRHLGGHGLGLLPAALRLTPFKKRRLIQLLHAFDVHESGVAPETSQRRCSPPTTPSVVRSSGKIRMPAVLRTASSMIRSPWSSAAI
ncbi:hypothetical protein ACVILK_005318 [Bradyrhizobium embrapense]